MNKCAMDTMMCSMSDLESMDDLRYKLHCVKFELQSTRTQFIEEKSKGEETMKQLLGHLETASKEREEARVQLRELQNMFFSNISGQTPRTKLAMSYVQAQSSTPFITKSSNEIQPPKIIAETYTSSNMVNSRKFAAPKGQARQHLSEITGYDYDSFIVDYLCMGSSLPEKGKLLQSVKEAGPLLGTLLIAGPIPKWKYPPHPLRALQVTSRPIKRSICGCVNTKAAEISSCFHGPQHASNASSLKLSLGCPQETYPGSDSCLNKRKERFVA